MKAQSLAQFLRDNFDKATLERVQVVALAAKHGAVVFTAEELVERDAALVRRAIKACVTRTAHVSHVHNLSPSQDDDLVGSLRALAADPEAVRRIVEWRDG